MAFEPNAHHVVSLALVPVRGRPNVGNGIDRADFLRDLQFESQVDSVRHRVKMINDFEPRLLSVVVDAGDVEQIIEREFVATKFGDFTQITTSNRVGRLATKFSLALKFLAERFAQQVEQLVVGHSSNVILSRAHWSREARSG